MANVAQPGPSGINHPQRGAGNTSNPSLSSHSNLEPSNADIMNHIDDLSVQITDSLCMIAKANQTIHDDCLKMLSEQFEVLNNASHRFTQFMNDADNVRNEPPRAPADVDTIAREVQERLNRSRHVIIFNLEENQNIAADRDQIIIILYILSFQ